MTTTPAESRKGRAKQLREKRLSGLSGVSNAGDTTDSEVDYDTYGEVIKHYLLSLDLSNQSPYVQLGIGGATGWFTGMVAGKVGKVLAAAMGGTILLVNMGTSAGYITVDWKKMEDDMHETSEKITRKLIEDQENNTTRRMVNQMSTFVQRNVVTAGGFAAGFFLGMAS